MIVARREHAAPGSTRRLFAVYAVTSLVPVVLLGALLMIILNHRADSAGVSTARDKAGLLARVTVAPLLGESDLRGGLTAGQKLTLSREVQAAIRNGEIVRLRLRDLDGLVVYSDDGSGIGAIGHVDDGVADAAAGHTVGELTWLNNDPDDRGPRGPRVVEVYEPVNAVGSGRRLGILEMYLPYAPIAADVRRSQHVVAGTLAAGLAVLWLCLLVISFSVTRRLQRQVGVNAFLASHDALTEMPNRAQFAERASREIAAATPQRMTAVALIDLDRFKEVNDTLGHGNGDRLLVMLADRLKAHTRAEDTVARLGGDEFGVVLSGLHGPGETVELLNRLRAVLGEPVVVNGLPLAVEASIGFALAPDDGGDVDMLLQRADVAMYAAKRKHLGAVRYRPEHDVYDSSALTLIAELSNAIQNNELRLHYQPKGDLRSGRVSAVEALVRWQHPVRGLLYPDAFLPAAEQTELIDPLTRWVLHEATSALPALDPHGEMAVAVNISARSLARPEFADDVLAVLAATNTDPHRVILELTETALLADPDHATLTLTRLHDAGLKVSIDDFGAGQTSLGYLARLPVSELKIDKAFVQAMLVDQRNAGIVRSVVELGHSLGFTVAAEGVETATALEQLRRFNCDTVQGYLLARPTPPDSLAAALTRTVEQVRKVGRPGVRSVPETPDVSRDEFAVAGRNRGSERSA